MEEGSFSWAVLASVCRSHSACSSTSRASADSRHSCAGASPFDSPTSPVLPGEPLLAPLLAQAPHRRSCRMSRRANPHSPQYPPASALSLLVPRICPPSSFQQAAKKKTCSGVGACIVVWANSGVGEAREGSEWVGG